MTELQRLNIPVNVDICSGVADMVFARLDDRSNPWLRWAGLGVGGYKAAQFKYLEIFAAAITFT